MVGIRPDQCLQRLEAQRGRRAHVRRRPGRHHYKQVTGLAWRHVVSAQVFEEAAVDLGRALSAYAEAKAGKRKDRVGFPRRKRKGRCRDSFRLRNKQGKDGRYYIRIGEGHPAH